ncbi:MAG: hypothetical protein ILO68_04605, partial [Clostridia bacterium]|nr:hypothetical protein [Clostridia bacterium]
LLKILKDANVVDSGGAGVVYLFEGFLGYLRGGVYPEDDPTEHEAPAPLNMDFSAFGPDSRFPYGYCTELLIQLLNECAPFDLSSFRRRLEELGESVAVTESDGKVKVHVHTPNPEQILAYCHPFGEFLHLKIENMSVQHSNADGIAGSEAAPGPGGTKPVSKPCVKKVEEPFGVVAVAPDEVMAKLFEDMGADAVITCKGNPSSNDYLEAFRTLDAESILVFPNHPNSILAAYNAAELYEDARVYVVESKSVAHCYAILPMLDYTEIDVESAMECAEETISRIEFASVVRAQKDSRYGDRDIKFGDYIALRSKDLLAVGSELGDVAVDAIRLILADRPTDVITVFCGQSISADSLDEVFNQLRKEFLFVEIQTVHTADALTDLLISFE